MRERVCSLHCVPCTLKTENCSLLNAGSDTDRHTDRHTETRTVFFFSESHASESYLAIPSLDTKFSLCVCSGELTHITE